MGLTDFAVDSVRRDAQLLRAAAERDLHAAVPTCPGWAMHDLLEHTGRVHHWAAGILDERAQEARPLTDAATGPDDPEQRVEWFAEGVEQVTAALSRAGEDTPVWNWSSGVSPSRFWVRRMPLETAVHRWDAENGAGAAQPVEQRLAVMGIEEMADVWLPRLSRRLQKVSLQATLHLHCTDTEGEWLVRISPEGTSVTREHAKGDVAVRATASDLYLLLWNRVGPERAEVFGDASLLSRFAENVRI